MKLTILKPNKFIQLLQPLKVLIKLKRYSSKEFGVRKKLVELYTVGSYIL